MTHTKAYDLSNRTKVSRKRKDHLQREIYIIFMEDSVCSVH